MTQNNKWTRPAAGPPGLFFGEKERDFVKQVNDEIIERVINQTVLYYSIDFHTTNYHPVYGEAIIKSFLPPVRVHAMVLWAGSSEIVSDEFHADNSRAIEVNFHKRRLREDQDIQPRVGDFLQYGSIFYEITELGEPRELFGQVDHKFEIAATCMRTRQGVFNGR